jgi:hypothetical protein
MTTLPAAQRTRPAVAATLALVLTLYGDPAAAAALTEPPQPQTNNPSMAALDRIGRQVAKQRCTRPQAAVLGAAESTATSAGRVGPEVVYACPGYRVVARRERVANATRETLTAVELSASHPAVEAAIGIGADVRSVIEALGAPDTVAGDDLIYPLSSDQPEAFQALIRIHNEHVVAITWRWPAR